MKSACRALASGVLASAAVALAGTTALAQQPMPTQANPACTRLEAQLQAYDRSSGNAARAEQIRKFREAAASQQAEIAREEANARSMGCQQNSFFVLFSGQPPQCGPINNKIQQMRANLDRIRTDLENLQAAPAPERDGQRRTILAALAQNSCGPQYQAELAAAPPRAGFFESLFGPRPSPMPPPDAIENLPPAPGSGGTYRTLCVRTCDGYYYPISYATNPSRFAEDERTCKQTCPAAEVMLFSHRNPGEDVNQAVSISGQPYTSLPNAFRYRQALDQSCSCRHPGESWAQALKSINDTVEQGDIVVNEQRARQMSQPRVDAQGKPIRLDPRAGAAPDLRPAQNPASASTATPDAAADEQPSKPDPNRKVRTVGPPFLPAR